MLFYTEKSFIIKKKDTKYSSIFIMWINISYLDHKVLLHAHDSKHLNSLHKQKLASSDSVLPTHLVAFTCTTNKNAVQLFTTYFILFSVNVDQVSLGVF